jgi:hypothetical protein
MKIIDQTLKEKGKWSISRLIIFFTFWSNIIFAFWIVWKTSVFVDLPVNWLALIVGMYATNRTAESYVAGKEAERTIVTLEKGEPNAVSSGNQQVS